MSDIPLLDHRDKILIITRRLFESDERQHFVGMVQRYDRGSIRAYGYDYVFQPKVGNFVRHKAMRTRIFPLDNQISVFVLPDDTELEAVRYEMNPELGLVVTDHKEFRLDMHEIGM